MKTLIFVGEGGPVMVVLPGDKKVDMKKLSISANQNISRMAKAEEVKEISGYSIGGVCPFAVEKDVKKIMGWFGS